MHMLTYRKSVSMISPGSYLVVFFIDISPKIILFSKLILPHISNMSQNACVVIRLIRTIPIMRSTYTDTFFIFIHKLTWQLPFEIYIYIVEHRSLTKYNTWLFLFYFCFLFFFEMYAIKYDLTNQILTIWLLHHW